MDIEIYLDGAGLEEILEYKGDSNIKGFTTNPSLMRQAGVTDYLSFAKELAKEIPEDKSVSLEVVSDDFDEMERQARKISELSHNFYVKIPIVNTKGQYPSTIVNNLNKDGVPLNITAVMLDRQIEEISKSLASECPNIISVFAGRIADTGRDPVEAMLDCKEAMWGLDNSKLLWASCREVYNVYQADEIGCEIITISPSMYKKLKTLKGKTLTNFSKETVQTFIADAKKAGYSL